MKINHHRNDKKKEIYTKKFFIRTKNMKRPIEAKHDRMVSR